MSRSEDPSGVVSRSSDPVRVAAAFAELAAVARDRHTRVDAAQRLVDVVVDLFDLWAAGMLVDDPGSTPKVLAASTHEAAVLELVQVRSGDGPCLRAMERGEVVVVEDLSEVEHDWPEWVAGARALGITAAYGVPMRVTDGTYGALNLFLRDDGALADGDLAVAVALADAATVTLLQQQAVADATTLAAQLQGALESRVLIEQAKGVLAERHDVTVAQAFVLLRDRARSTSRALSSVAQAVVDGSEPELDGRR
jgi:hypothetical protein